jgi:predicted metal-binding protein
MMNEPATTIFVCVSCRRRGQGGDADPAHTALVAALRERFAAASAGHIRVEPVECLAVCKRPTTIAMVGPGKWTYLIGDLEMDAHLDEIVEAVLSYGRSENGIVPWKERPASFRSGVVARIPPLGFVMQEQESA